MTGNDMIDDDFDDNLDSEIDAEETSTDLPKKDSEMSAKTRKRIDELLEKKRLRELLDEDEWEL
ncbi:PA3496 family putative envelope integrity protein [Thalassotalea litorea]|uniref:PA3496 family putative envelope integrity protein n=1 Tax=Thalassotalea litorea TaxID=2020715 RepID=UPI003736877F